MTVSQIFTIARFLTNTNSTTATDAKLLACLNERNKQMTIALAKIKGDYQLERSTSDIIANQEEYPMPTDCLRLKRLEAKYDDGDWVRVPFMDINEDSGAQDTETLSENYEKTAPYADIMDNSIFMRPVPTTAVTGGLKLWYVVRPADMTLTTETPDTPVELHRTLADMIALDIRQMKGEMTYAQALQAEAAIMEQVKAQAEPRQNDPLEVARAAQESYE